jgi:predicted outer membrane repeat protein
MRIVGATFENNFADEKGGAVLSQGSLTLEKCLFRNNTARSWGGAVAVEGRSSRATVLGSRFDHNSGGAGGAIWSQAQQLNVTGCSFTANAAVENTEANSKCASSSSSGGAIFVDVDRLLLPSLQDNCQQPGLSLHSLVFSNNSAPQAGASVFLTDALVSQECLCRDCSFENSLASYNIASPAASLRLSPTSARVKPGQGVMLSVVLLDHFKQQLLGVLPFFLKCACFVSLPHPSPPPEPLVRHGAACAARQQLRRLRGKRRVSTDGQCEERHGKRHRDLPASA